jgi:hypothetical protein
MGGKLACGGIVLLLVFVCIFEVIDSRKKKNNEYIAVLFLLIPVIAMFIFFLIMPMDDFNRMFNVGVRFFPQFEIYDLPE